MVRPETTPLPLLDPVSPEDEAAALAYLKRAHREARTVDGLDAAGDPAPICTGAVIGAGTMGGGIALCFANAGLPVLLLDVDRDALARSVGQIRKTVEASVRRGRLTAEDAVTRVALIEPTLDLERIGQADVVIESAFEDLAVKRTVFEAIDRTAAEGALLATNTSGLDVDAIAGFTTRPEAVVGLHFFSPASVMRLVEVVRGARTSPLALKRAIALAEALGKTPVVVGVCPSFVGNRMMRRRNDQVDALLLEGALPEAVDGALKAFGFRMGPLELADMAGNDIARQGRLMRGVTAPVADAVYEAGRLGQKSGAGYYRYVDGDRTPRTDPEAHALIEAVSDRLGITRREIGADEILERMLLPIFNEGALILEEGIAARPGDIDVIWDAGYGWPRRTGGPMHLLDRLGRDRAAARLAHYAERLGDPTLTPAESLMRSRGPA